MATEASSAARVLDALGYALFRRDDDGALKAATSPPEWLRALWPAIDAAGAALPIAEASPFFENFLIDAEECWNKGGAERAKSGPWIEQPATGEQVELEATALTAGGEKLLLLERLGHDFAAKKDVLQRARETVIAHQRLNSEIQKKEILLHCVADEMTAALANIVTSLRLIETEDNSPRTKMLLGLAMRGTEEQQRLIHRVLDVFAEEIGGIYGRKGSNGAIADWNAVRRRAVEAMEPVFAEKHVTLRPPKDALGELKIAVDAGHFERVVAALLETALERTPAGEVVALEQEVESDALLCRIVDGAPRMSADAYTDLFASFRLPAASSQASSLRLHFCRILIESCGGEIGCEPGAQGGNAFWFRVPIAKAK